MKATRNQTENVALSCCIKVQEETKENSSRRFCVRLIKTISLHTLRGFGDKGAGRTQDVTDSNEIVLITGSKNIAWNSFSFPSRSGGTRDVFSCAFRKTVLRHSARD
jgi:hypothetical protein